MSPATLLTQLFLIFCIALTPYISHANEDSKPTAISISTNGKININAANANLLAQTLKGVGLKKAQAIVAYRNDFGPFHNVHELEAVAGIGKSILSQNIDRISAE